MTQQRRTALKELQKVDLKILEAGQRIRDFDPLFEEVEEPALILEAELATTRKRLAEMKSEEERLEISTAEKKDRLKRLEARVSSVRNLREEAAVSAELEMVKRALQNDEQEAFSLLDLVRKGDERLVELEAASAEANELVEPKRDELLAKRDAAKSELASLEKQRKAFTGKMDPGELRIYDAIRGGGGRAAVAELTQEGACGNCFTMVPLQIHNEVLHGDALIRCEACGVVLAAPEPVDESVPEIPADAPLADADTASDEHGVMGDNADEGEEKE